MHGDRDRAGIVTGRDNSSLALILGKMKIKLEFEERDLNDQTFYDTTTMPFKQAL